MLELLASAATFMPLFTTPPQPIQRVGTCPQLVLDRRLLFAKPLKRIHVPDLSLTKTPFINDKKAIHHAKKPFMTGTTLPSTLPLGLPLVRAPRPAQYALGGSALEWQGYRALCARMQQAEASGSTAADRSKKGPGAEALDP
jgi:hypothetical protein